MGKTLWAAALMVVGHLAQAGAIEIHDGVIGETPPGQTVAGAHFTITNTAGTDCVLTGASSEVSPRVLLHGHTDDNGVMRMRPLDSLPVPAGTTLDSRDAGFHLMLHDLEGGVAAGDTVDIVLEFDGCGQISAPFSVQRPHHHH